MKKNIFTLLLVFMCFAQLSQAQDKAFDKGALDINAGIGLLPTFYGSYATSKGLPLNLAVDYGVHQNISVGGYLGYASAKYQYSNFWSWKYTYTIIGIRGAYHFAIKDPKIDLYAGLMLGYNIARYKDTSTGNTFGTSNSYAAGGGVTYSAFGGARYRFTPKFGAFAELGYGISLVQLGLNFKVK